MGFAFVLTLTHTFSLAHLSLYAGSDARSEAIHVSFCDSAFDSSACHLYLHLFFIACTHIGGEDNGQVVTDERGCMKFPRKCYFVLPRYTTYALTKYSSCLYVDSETLHSTTRSMSITRQLADSRQGLMATSPFDRSIHPNVIVTKQGPIIVEPNWV